ncbi:DUF3040 domain-containing protein [Actinomycetospora flava]|uniref:DUF3040 domain-containing protein n=1 Tax=Actinomycetospora flava TaxID=3129232 RepID=UPI0035A13AAA
MPYTPPPDPGSRGGRPLSDRERDVLAHLEASLDADDPGLSARMSWGGPQLFRGVSPQVLNRTVQASVVLIIALVALPTEWRAGLVVLLVMLVPVAVGMWAVRAGERPVPPPSENRPPP